MLERFADSPVMRGTYGAVRFGVDDHGERVAIKISNYGRKSSHEDKLIHLEVAMNEANAYAQLQSKRAPCPQILGMRYIAHGPTKMALVFDSWDWDLARLLGSHKAEELEVSMSDRLAMMIDVAKGLSHMHECKPRAMVHGDVKHNNVLARFCPRQMEWRACVMDLGLAVTLGTKDIPRSEHPQDEYSSYMPDDAFITTAFDVFSYGVLLARVLLLDFENYGTQDVASVLQRALRDAGARARLLDEFCGNQVAMEEVLDLVGKCVSRCVSIRPTMSRMAVQLQQMRRLIIASETRLMGLM